jgi:hypothetical protein
VVVSTVAVVSAVVTPEEFEVPQATRLIATVATIADIKIFLID